MAKVSNRGNSIPVSAMRKYIPYADAARERGIDVIPLNLGQPDIPTPDVFWEAIEDFRKKEPAVGYAPSRGRPELLKATKTYFSRFGINVEPEEVVVSVGGCEAILMTVLAITDPGERILVLEPYYSNYAGVFAESSVDFDVVTTNIETGFHLPSREEIEAAIVPGKTKAIMYASPGNPTGTPYTQEEIEMLGEIALKHGLWLVGDEVYREFSYGGSTPYSCLQLRDEVKQRVILTDSFSKRYSACGARIGLVVSKNKDLITAVTRLATVRLSAPALDQVGIAAVIEDGVQDYLKDVNAKYTARRDRLLAGLRAIPGVEAPTPGGAFYVVARLPGIDTDKFCRWLLESFSLDNRTVLVAPAGGFYKTEGKGKDEIRIAYVLNEDRIQQAVDVLTAAVKKWREENP